MNQNPSGGTRPFTLLRRCARVGFAAFELLQPDLARAVSPMLGLLVFPAAKPAPRTRRRAAPDAMLAA